MDLSWLSQVTADKELALVRGWLHQIRKRMGTRDLQKKKFGPTPLEKAAIASLSPEYMVARVPLSGCTELVRVPVCMSMRVRACVCVCACGYRVWLFRQKFARLNAVRVPFQ